MLAGMAPCLTLTQLQALQNAVGAVAATPAVLDYLQNLLDATRNGRWFEQGLSPRAGLAVLRAAKAWALVAGRRYVAPDDVAAVFPVCAAHRLVPVGGAGLGALQQVQALLRATPLP